MKRKKKCFFVLHTFLTTQQFNAQPPTLSYIEPQQRPGSHIMNNLLQPISRRRAEQLFLVHPIFVKFAGTQHSCRFSCERTVNNVIFCTDAILL